MLYYLNKPYSKYELYFTGQSRRYESTLAPLDYNGSTSCSSKQLGILLEFPNSLDHQIQPFPGSGDDSDSSIPCGQPSSRM